jgi:hypothetical protein
MPRLKGSRKIRLKSGVRVLRIRFFILTLHSVRFYRPKPVLPAFYLRAIVLIAFLELKTKVLVGV